jgi:hypothetical protein
LPALQRLVEGDAGPDHNGISHISRVLVTGLGPCADATMSEFAPLERAALLRALANPPTTDEAAPRLRYCRMEKLRDGDTFAQVCDRPSSDDNRGRVDVIDSNSRSSDYGDVDSSHSRGNSGSSSGHDSQHEEGGDHPSHPPLRPPIAPRPPNRRVVVSHGEPCALKPRTHFPNALAVVARTMTETSALSAQQRECLKLAAADELWVPTPWGAEVLANDAVINVAGWAMHHGAAVVAVVPETVDGDFLDPALVETEILGPADTAALAGPTRLWQYGASPAAAKAVATATAATASASAAPALREPEEAGAAAAVALERLGVSSDCGLARHDLQRQRFVVVSIFKWGHRKGWDVLLEAYWRAFLDPQLLAHNAGERLSTADASSSRRNDSSSTNPAAEVVLCLRTSKPKIGLTGEVFESRFGGASAGGDAGGVGGEIRAYARHFLRTYKPPPDAEPIAGAGSAATTATPALAPADGVASGVLASAVARTPMRLVDLPAVEVYGQPLSRVALRALMGRANAFALPHRGEVRRAPQLNCLIIPDTRKTTHNLTKEKGWELVCTPIMWVLILCWNRCEEGIPLTERSPP